MQGTMATANASSWFIAAPNEGAVNVVIAQKFAATNVPYGATDIFASPEPKAKCDAMALQVIPSPLSCERLRQTLAAHGMVIAELVGLPLLAEFQWADHVDPHASQRLRSRRPADRLCAIVQMRARIAASALTNLATAADAAADVAVRSARLGRGAHTLTALAVAGSAHALIARPHLT
jgi:hypothetical protein